MAFDFSEFPLLRTKRLILRELTEDDAADFFDLWADETMQDGYDAAGFANVEGARKHIRVKKNSFNRKQTLTWGIQKTRSSRIIGVCLLGDFELQSKADLSYYLATDSAGKGIMTEAVQAVVGFGVGELGLHRIQAFVRPDNVASIRVVEKAGFHREGLLRLYHPSKQRGWVDKISYSLLSTDDDLASAG